MLRHRRRQWAAMDFLLQSYRKQRKWLRMRQILLLLSRLAIAALLIAMLCGWTGGGRALQILGGTTTHHVVILDDSYSMGDATLLPSAPLTATGLPATAYGRSLGALQDLTRRLASEDSNHQLTVMRASRAAMAVRGGSQAGDAAADLSAQTITTDRRLVNRLMSTSVSSIRTDIGSALDLASDLISNTPADSTFLYIASDFRQRDWGSADRLAAAIRRLPSEVAIRMIDCGVNSNNNLAITDVSPTPDVWVAGVPVVINVTVKNYSINPVRNIPLRSRVIKYGGDLNLIDASRAFSGEPESLPDLTIESLGAGEVITKSFQVFINQPGTHAIEVSIPDDALAIDNTRTCTLPLTDVERVLIIDGDTETRGAYHVSSVLDPGSQVRIGAIPEIKPPAFLRSASWETLAPYRAIYLIDLPEIGENAAAALDGYVRRGGGLAWFLGEKVIASRYNETLLLAGRQLLPGRLGKRLELAAGQDKESDIKLGEASDKLFAPLASAGQAAFGLVGLSETWQIQPDGETLDRTDELGEEVSSADDSANAGSAPEIMAPEIMRPEIMPPEIMPPEIILERRDGMPFVLQHNVQQGRVVTVLAGLDGSWTNWPGDPTFVVFMLQTNALLWSGASPPTTRYVDDSIALALNKQRYTSDVEFVPAANEPPRFPIELSLTDSANSPETNSLQTNSLQTNSPEANASESVWSTDVKPYEQVISGDANVDQWMRPGISEWSLTALDGSKTVRPVAGVVRVGEGDLRRAEQAEISQQLLPRTIKFVSSDVWSNQNQFAGSSRLSLALLGLLALILAAEQALAYWASYHVGGGKNAKSRRQATSGGAAH